jgi:antitoxin ParD1/3/4
MTITLELTPDVEEKLRESAARRDVEAIRCLLAELLTPTVELLLKKTLPDTDDTDFEALADQLADQLVALQVPDAPPLSDYAVSREGIYEEHP